jgi:hypothetical protein
MFKRNLIWLLGLAVVLSIASGVGAQQEPWIYLGHSHVDGIRDHDNIKITDRYGRFSALQFRVSGGTVEFDRVLIHYGNGSIEQIFVRRPVHDGQRTQPIRLPGGHRVIKKVEFWYSQDDPHSRPTVDVFGAR